MGSTVIQVLEVILLIVGILAVGRIFFLVGDLQRTLVNLEQTRGEITTTLKRVESVADETERLMREEVAPTLKIARDTLVNVEVTTRALAESTVIVRQAAGMIENAQKMFTVSGPIAQALMKKVGNSAGGFFSGITRGISMVLGKGKSQPAAKIESKESVSGTAQAEARDSVAIPGTATTNPVLHADAPPLAAKATKNKK